MNHVLAAFSPKSKDRDVLYPKDKADIDILIATDCISEGQNLQDCDYCINYDIHRKEQQPKKRFELYTKVQKYKQDLEKLMRNP